MYLNVSKAATALAALSSAVTHWSAGSTPNATLTKRTEVAPGIELRIMPLGDSITDGFQSSDGNGYRIGLHDNLAGSKLLFVGDRTAGNMANNENAGYSGFTISEIASAASHAISSAGSNIVLLHAGTNDMHANSPAASESYDTAPDRLGSLIDQCIQGNPDAVVIVAQIVNSGDSATEARIQTFNNAIPGVVAQRANAGHHVVVVDMRSVTTAYLKDDLHPNDAGYKMMADLWFASIQAVGVKGWIKPPLGLDPIGGSTAACSSGQKQRCLGNPVWYNPSASGIIASGVGHGGDGKFSVNWQPLGRVGSGIGLNGTNVRFADLNGDGRADYLWLNETNGAVIAYLNTGSGNKMSWAPLNDAKEIASGGGPGAGVRFADISGSGKAGYLFVEDSGAVHLYANGGPDSKGGWLWLGPRQIASGVPNAKQDNVFFPDLNGDGRADYVVIGQKGEVTLWLNIGSSLSYDITWVPLGEVASGLNTPNISLVDISGDGRADYMIWDQLGGLTGYLNARGPKEVPVWLDQGADKSIGTGVGVDWTLCHLADFNADGKADYAVVDIKTGGFDLYLNNGKADTSVTGDGVYLIDMDNDGLDDYVFMDEDGSMILYTNGGPGNNGWVWLPQGKVGTGVGATREQIRLAYIFGHGRADYVVVDDITGAITVWENGGPANGPNGGWLWFPQGQQATGVGKGKGVRFADINGDGKDDYIWLDENGAATVYMNEIGINGAKWVPLNDGKPVALGVGALREDVRFADIDGDGRADYIWVHPLDGSVEAWRNLAVDTPSSINWVPYSGRIAAGVGFAGANIKFAYLNHPRTGRTDYVAVEPGNGALHVWLSDCSDLAPADSPSTAHGDCQSGHGASIVPPSGGTSPTKSANPSSQPGNSPSVTFTGPSPTSPVILTTISGITVPGVVTIGNPTIVPGAVPTSSGIASLQPLASQAAQLYASAESAIATLASATSLSSSDVSSAEQALARVYSVLQVLLADAQGIDPQSVGGSDAQQLQNLRAQLPSLLSQLGSAITQLGPSTLGTPDSTAIHDVAGLLRPEGAIGQALSSDVLPIALHSAPINPGSGSGGGGGGSGGGGGGGGTGGSNGNGDEITISGFTTIPSNTGLGSLPTSGPSAISALRPAASQLSSAIDAAGQAASSLASDSNASSGATSGLLSLLSGLFQDASALGSGLDGIELSSFSAGDVPQIIEAQSGAKNLAQLALDITKDVASNLIDIKRRLQAIQRAHTLLVHGGSIVVVGASVTGFILNFHESATSTTTQASTTSSTSSSTATPSEWLLNTVPGTSLDDFEAFVQKLPDRGAGRRITYPELNYQNYIGKMTLDQARIVNTNPIVDQISANDPLDDDLPPIGELRKRGPNVQITRQPGAERYLKVLSYPRDRNWVDLQNNFDDPLNDYTFEASQGAESFIYIIDTGFDFNHPELRHLQALRPQDHYVANHVRDENGNIVTSFRDNYGHGTPCSGVAVGAILGVAKGASWIGVKFRDLARSDPEALTDAWRWAISDVVAKGRQGKAVINLSYSFSYKRYISRNGHFDYAPYRLPVPAQSDFVLPLLAEAWSHDIVTVVSCSNRPEETFGDTSPQRYGTADNALITVMQVLDNGFPVFKQSIPGPARDGADSHLVGSNTIYVDTENIRGGSSYGAPQIAGLAAYLLGVPYLSPPLPGTVAMEMKRRIVLLARVVAPVGAGSIGAGGAVANNGVFEIFCAPTGPPKKARRTVDYITKLIQRSRTVVRSLFTRSYVDVVARQNQDPQPNLNPIYISGAYVSNDLSSRFQCPAPTGPPNGFSISSYIPEGPNEPSYYAFNANTLGKCVSSSSGLQITEQGWLDGPPVVNVTLSDSFILTLYTDNGATPDQLCGTATSMKFTKKDAAHYGFTDSNGVSGICTVDPNAQALAGYQCDFDGGRSYAQELLLSCENPDDPRYCDRL